MANVAHRASQEVTDTLWSASYALPKEPVQYRTGHDLMLIMVAPLDAELIALRKWSATGWIEVYSKQIHLPSTREAI